MNNSSNNSNNQDMDYDQAQGRGSSDDEKESLTPAQSRRKAQNRAAYVFPLTSYLSTSS